MNIVGMRLTGKNKKFYENQLTEFEGLLADKGMAYRVEFGKQDIRGAFSISLYDGDNRIKQQRFFETKQELLGYVVGYLSADRPWI